LRKESEEFWLTNFYVDRPCLVILVGFFILILISIGSVMGGFFEINTEGASRDFLIWNDPIVLEGTKSELALERVENITGEPELAVRSEAGLSSFLLYENKDSGNEYGLLQKEVLV
jgi:hypothetical protein